MDSERSVAVKTKSRSTARSSSTRRSGKKIQPSRNVLVGMVLLGSLGLTGMLLVVLAPSPLVPDARSLMSYESIDKAFVTRTSIKQDQWKTIYVRHTATRAGNAELIGQQTAGGMGDHFLIGNGYGCGDGELQMSQRWYDQTPAARPNVARDCITICLVGDFDQSQPTDRQMESLARLVGALQKRFGIRTEDVIVYDRPGSPTGIGRNFPIGSLAQALK